MNILEALIKLRDDLKFWTANNLKALDNKISESNLYDDYSGILEIADKNGNVIARIDAEGIHTTNIFADHFIDNADIFSVADKDGNVIARIDAKGIHTTNLFINEIHTQGKASDNSKDITIADMNGNIIVQIDEFGVESIDFYIQGTSLKEKIHMWDSKTGFSGDYNDLRNQPNILENKSNEFTIVDKKGYIIAKFNQDGLETTQINSNKIILNNEDLEEKIANIMDNEELQNQLNTLYNEIYSIDYNSLKNAPPITSVQEQKLRVVDEQGNIVCLIDADGITTTKINTDELILSNTSMDAEFADFNQRLENFDERIDNFTNSVSTTIGEKFTEFNEEINSHESIVNTKINNFQTKITNFENSITLTKVTYSTTDLVPGTSTLKTGELYIVYE